MTKTKTANAEARHHHQQVIKNMGWFGGIYQRSNKKFRRDYTTDGLIDYNKLPTKMPSDRYPMAQQAFFIKQQIDAQSKKFTQDKQSKIDELKAKRAKALGVVGSVSESLKDLFHKDTKTSKQKVEA